MFVFLFCLPVFLFSGKGQLTTPWVMKQKSKKILQNVLSTQKTMAAPVSERLGSMTDKSGVRRQEWQLSPKRKLGGLCAWLLNKSGLRLRKKAEGSFPVQAGGCSGEKRSNDRPLGCGQGPQERAPVLSVQVPARGHWQVGTWPEWCQQAWGHPGRALGVASLFSQVWNTCSGLLYHIPSGKKVLTQNQHQYEASFSYQIGPWVGKL